MTLSDQQRLNIRRTIFLLKTDNGLNHKETIEVTDKACITYVKKRIAYF